MQLCTKAFDDLYEIDYLYKPKVSNILPKKYFFCPTLIFISWMEKVYL